MIARGITYLPQQPSLFPHLSVEINLRLGLWHARARTRDAAARIERVYGQFPVLREKRRQPAGQLSGGQQRQLEIARAYLTDPELYLIDEPTAGVDPITSAEVYRIIERLAHEEGRAILLVDQDIKRALARCRPRLRHPQRRAVRRRTAGGFRRRHGGSGLALAERERRFLNSSCG